MARRPWELASARGVPADPTSPGSTGADRAWQRADNGRYRELSLTSRTSAACSWSVKVKILAFYRLGSRSRIATGLYHRFPEQIVAHVPITTLLQRGYTVNKIVLVLPTRPDERYKRSNDSAAPSAPASAGGAMRVGVRGMRPKFYRARGGT